MAGFWAGFSQGLEEIAQRKQQKELQQNEIDEARRSQKSDQDFRLKLFQLQAAADRQNALLKVGASRAKSQKEAAKIAGKANYIYKLLGADVMQTEQGKRLMESPDIAAQMADYLMGQQKEFGKETSKLDLSGLDLLNSFNIDYESGFVAPIPDFFVLPKPGGLDEGREVVKNIVTDLAMQDLEAVKNDPVKYSELKKQIELYQEEPNGPKGYLIRKKYEPQAIEMASEIDSPFTVPLQTGTDPLFQTSVLDESLQEAEVDSDGLTDEQIQAFFSVVNNPTNYSPDTVRQVEEYLRENGFIE